jgi:hypothetical protein
VLVAHSYGGVVITAGVFAERAGANVTKVEAGHLSLITRPAEVTEVILSAVDATSDDAQAGRAAEVVGVGRVSDR